LRLRIPCFFCVQHRRFTAVGNKVVIPAGAELALLHLFATEWTLHGAFLPENLFLLRLVFRSYAVMQARKNKVGL
jgi:hypothetical protein